MLYVPKEALVDNLVADAKQLMREINRVDGVLNDLDQNNIRVFSSASMVLPSVDERGATKTHDGGSLILATGNAAAQSLDVPCDEKTWVYVLDTSGTAPMELEFTSNATAPFMLFGSVKIECNDATNPSYGDLRLLVDGEPTTAIGTFFAYQNALAQARVAVQDVVWLPPGLHTITMKIRERRPGTTGASNAMDLKLPYMFAVG